MTWWIRRGEGDREVYFFKKKKRGRRVENIVM